MQDASKPLRSKLLAVPSLKAKYLEYVRMIARDGLDWQKLGAIVKQRQGHWEPRPVSGSDRPPGVCRPYRLLVRSLSAAPLKHARWCHRHGDRARKLR